jgi:hypothetical protein
MIETTKVFQYRILQELPIDHLANFKHHHRLTVFYHKGTTCVQCNKTGTRLIKGEGRGGQHWDIYTDDLYPLTVDHIIPKSRGGGESLDNKQPMCAGCNFKKGNGEKSYSRGDWVPAGFYKCSLLEDLNLIIGKPVWKRTPKSNSNRKHKKLYHFATCSGVTINPQTKRIAATVVEKPGVLFDLKTLFVSRDDYETGTDTHFSSYD